jgi:hypothetical protein
MNQSYFLEGFVDPDFVPFITQETRVAFRSSPLVEPIAAVPLPATLPLGAVGIALLMLIGRRRARSGGAA